MRPEEASLLAIALAHSGRLVEARALAEPALALQRELDARRTDERMHKLLCLALVAMAAATPDQRKPCSRRGAGYSLVG